MGMWAVDSVRCRSVGYQGPRTLRFCSTLPLKTGGPDPQRELHVFADQMALI
jgi:hypothetical protein